MWRMRQNLVAQFVQLLKCWLLVVQCVVGHCCGEELGPFCGPVLAEGIAFFGASHRFAENTSQR